MPRAIWSGTISFGLVNVPVRMLSAIREHKLHFHYLHVKDDSRIGYEKICKLEGRPVADDEIVKAFEFEKGQYVHLTDEDFEAAAAEVQGQRAIEIRDFVPYEEIDPIYFERTYYLTPEEGSERIYALLVHALERSGLAAVAKFVMRDRQNLGVLRVRDGLILLERMYFADEVVPAAELAPGKVKIDERELDMALQLVDRYTGTFKPEKYKDTYRDALCEIIRAKRRGEEVHVEAVPEPEPPSDLMAALKASLEAAQRRRNGGRRDGDLSRLSKDELYALAKKADVPGRSDMSKEELVAALEREAA